MSKSNTIICTAKKCYSSILTHPSKSFFGFPSDIPLCKIWLENCGRTDLNIHQVISRKLYKLCEDHFEEKWFTDSTKKVLKRKLNPIPTIFANNINSLLSPGTELKSVNANSILNTVDLLREELSEEEEEQSSVTLDLEDISLTKHHLPISYHTKPLLKSVEVSDEIVRKDQLNFDVPTEHYNMDKICRFCMAEVLINFIDLFSETDIAKEIRKVSSIIFPNKVSVCDGLPHKVCQTCATDLRTCHRLIEQFKNADKQLRAIAKYSLFVENENTTTEITNENEEGRNGLSDELMIPLRSFEESFDRSCQYFDASNIDESFEYESNLNFIECIVTANKSSDSRHSNHLKRSLYEDTGGVNTSKFKNHGNHDVKLYRKYTKRRRNILGGSTASTNTSNQFPLNSLTLFSTVNNHHEASTITYC